MQQSVKGLQIFVGLSGGVDSAVSAALLARAGARVTGVFIKGWYPSGMPCTWAADRRDAMRVAAHLHIPFVTLDASAEYKRSVIEYLLREYAAGRTPNPDIMCNKEVKFGAFYRFARENGADAIATGHYLAGEKDQRYFLWAVPPEALAHAVFPVATMAKREVRALARRFRLPVADKRDSQGVCFLGSVSVEDFLKEEFGTRSGIALDEAGNAVGTHDGAMFVTIGERVTLRDAPPGPWYVRAKDMAHNVLSVGLSRMESADTLPREIRFHDANWIHDADSVREAQLRYRGPRIEGHVADGMFVAHEPLREPVASGQSIVFYDALGELVGGGIIAT